MSTPLSSIGLVFLASFIGSFGAVFLKSGAVRLEWSLAKLVQNWRLAAGVCFFVVSSMFFIAGLRNGELSVLYPMVALGYVWTMVWSRIFFGEPFTRTKFIGLAMILVGIACLGVGNSQG